MKLLGLSLILFFSLASAVCATAEPASVLWIDSLVRTPELTQGHRRTMVTHLNSFEQGAFFEVSFIKQTSRGTTARALQGKSYDIIVVDGGNPSAQFSNDDLEALKAHYASGRRSVMLDGSLVIRSITDSPLSRFPGANGSSAAMLVNQMVAIARAGGGFLIGTDHDRFQRDSNQVVSALIPGARFSGRTNPSTDGNFIGEILLGEQVPVRPVDILRHWESIPSQGEAPVGAFTDFLGNSIELFALVEAADKPGGGRQRPYISASFDPGDKKYSIDSEEPVSDNMPTRVGPGRTER